jgi:hypothetical protein
LKVAPSEQATIFNSLQLLGIQSSLPSDKRAEELPQVDQPAACDLNEAISECQKNIDSPIWAGLRGYENKVQSGDSMTPHDVSQFNRLAEIMNSLKGDKELFEKFLEEGIQLGYVYAGSGQHRILPTKDQRHQRYDWALIKVDP